MKNRSYAAIAVIAAGLSCGDLATRALAATPRMVEGLDVSILSEVDTSYTVADLEKIAGRPVPGASTERWLAQPLAISDDGSRIAWIVSLPRDPAPPIVRDAWVLVNGTPGPRFDEINRDTVTLSRDGRHLIYAARSGKPDGATWSLVRDGVAGRPHRVINTPIFSPDGNRLAYRATREDYAQVLIIDSHESDPFEHATPVVFTPDSKHFAYASMGLNRKGWRLVVDGKQVAGDPAGAVFPRSVVLSPDAKRVAMLARSQDQAAQLMVFVDGAFGAGSHDILDGSLRFDNDSNRLAYVAAADTKNNYTVVVDHKPGATYNFVFAPSLVFTPDNRLAYVAGTGPREGSRFTGTSTRDPSHSVPAGTPTLFVDGKPHPNVAIPDAPPVFSPDGRRLAYFGQPAADTRNRAKSVIVDGKPDPATQRVRFLQFSPDGAHYAYLADASTHGGQTSLVIDGKPHRLLDLIILDMTLDNAGAVTATTHNLRGIYRRIQFK